MQTCSGAHSFKNDWISNCFYCMLQHAARGDGSAQRTVADGAGALLFPNKIISFPLNYYDRTNEKQCPGKTPPAERFGIKRGLVFPALQSLPVKPASRLHELLTKPGRLMPPGAMGTPRALSSYALAFIKCLDAENCWAQSNSLVDAKYYSFPCKLPYINEEKGTAD